jgi:predicted phage tail protein
LKFMTHVKLMGEIGEKFGSEWDMNVSNFRDMFRLIDCQTEGFGPYLIDCANKGINFTIQNGEDLVDGTLDALVAPVKDTVIITPIATGAGASDVFKVIVGAILIYYGAGWMDSLFAGSEAAVAGEAAAAAEAGSAAAAAGDAAAFAESQQAIQAAGQKAEMLSKAKIAATRGVQALGTRLGMEGVTGYLTPDSPSEAGKSYLYDGPENNVLQGAPVPLLYGRLLVGGSVINFAFIESQLNYANGYTTVSDDRDEKDDDGTTGKVTEQKPV